MTNTLMTTIMWAIAIAHVLTDRVLSPFLLSVIEISTPETEAVTNPSVAVASAPVDKPDVIKTSRSARRRKSSRKVDAL